MLRYLSGLIVTLTLVPCFAATTLEFQMTHEGQVFPQIAYIDQGRLLVKSAGGVDAQDLLFIEDTQTLQLIDHSEKRVSEFDTRELLALAGQAQGVLSVLQSQLENLPPEQREQMEEMLGISLQGSEPPPELALIEKGDREISSFRCRQLEIRSGESPLSSICVADTAELGIPTEDLTVVESLQAVGDQMKEQAGALAKQFGAHIPEYGFGDFEGMAVEIVDYSGPGDSKMTLQSVTQGIGGAVLTAPQEYEVQTLGDLTEIIQ